MNEIYGLNGEVLNEKMIEVDGFKFDAIAMQENPFLMIMATICIDPTPKQAELLLKTELKFQDAEGKQIFPRVAEEPEEA